MKRKARKPKPPKLKRSILVAKMPAAKKRVKQVAKKSASKGAKIGAKKAGAAAVSRPDAIDLLITAGTQALRLPLDPAWYGGVKFNLGLIMRLAAVVDDFPLADDAEPGPVFHA
jgi:hypothetical protein